MSADGAGDGGTKQRFELYIKASAIDKETKGSCPICQHWFMITCLLGENQDDIDFKVYTVQADCPPKNFGVDQGWSKKFPVVMVLEGRDKKGQDLSGTKYDTFEELEVFFESINKECRELKRKNAPNVAAMQAVEDVYNVFNASLNTGKTIKLKSALKKMKDFLESDDCKYLVDNTLSFADCYLLPRLQHIRVAGKEYLSFDIPEEYTAIWKYLADAYQTEAFRSTMPSDQDIIFHYEKKASNLLKGQKRRPRPTLQNFTYTLDIPETCVPTLQSSADNTDGDFPEPPPPTEQMLATDIQTQLQDEVPQFSQEQVEASADVYVAADHEDVGVADDGGAVDQAYASEEAVTVEAAAVSQAEMVEEAATSEAVMADEGFAADEAAVTNEAVTADEAAAIDEAVTADDAVAADEAVTADEAVVTNASPTVQDDVGVDDTITTEGDQSTQDVTSEDVTGEDGGVGGDADVTVTVNTNMGGSDAVSDNVAEGDNSAADNVGGIRITFGEEEDNDDVQKGGVGNGDVIKEKDDTITKDDVRADDEVADVDGNMP